MTLDKETYDALVAKWSAMGLKDLALEFQRVKQQYEDEKAISARTYAEFEVLRKQILPKAMDDMGLETAKVEGVGRIQIGVQVSAKQVDKMALMTWLEANGHSSLIAESVNSSTLSSFMKVQIAQGEPFPDDSIVDFTTFEVASVVKA